MEKSIHVLVYTQRSVGTGLRVPKGLVGYETDFTKPLAHAFGQKWLSNLSTNSQPVVVWLFSVLRHGNLCLPPSLDARIEVAELYSRKNIGAAPKGIAHLLEREAGFNYVFSASPQGSYFLPWNDFSKVLYLIHPGAFWSGDSAELVPASQYTKMLQSFQSPRKLSDSIVPLFEAHASETQSKEKAFISYRRREAALYAMQATLSIDRLNFAPWFDQWSMPRQVAEEKIFANAPDMKVQIQRALQESTLAVSLRTKTYDTPSSPYTELESAMIRKLVDKQQLQHLSVSLEDCTREHKAIADGRIASAFSTYVRGSSIGSAPNSEFLTVVKSPSRSEGASAPLTPISIGIKMPQSIDTPYGPYLPQAPLKEEMESAASLMHEEVEAIAELIHDEWSAKRIAEGWCYGPKRDDDRKLHPCLVAYAHLPEAEKAYDRNTAQVVVVELLRRGLIRAK